MEWRRAVRLRRCDVGTAGDGRSHSYLIDRLDCVEQSSVGLGSGNITRDDRDEYEGTA